MADNFFKVKKGLNVEPQASPTLNQDGDIAVDSATNKLNVRLNGATDDVVLEDAAQTLTNKTLTAPVISSISNTGTLTLPTSTDTLVGRATTDTLTNKTLTAPNIDVVTFDGQASAPANPSAGNYKVYVDDTTSKLQILDSSGTVTTVGTSAGGINYITNGDAEAATTGWATYADAAGTSPVDGTGGSATTTFTRSTSSPLRGLGSFLLTKDAANRQGEGASYAFTIADADKAKMMQIDFELEVNSGTYVTGDVAVYIYDVTNAAIIQPSGYQVENVGIESRQRLTFQTASNSTSYRLCFHVASTSALAYALKVDTITLGPQIVPLGAPVTDWVSYTPTTAGLGTPTSVNFKWRRVGDSVEIQGRLAVGTTTAVAAAISLPSGLVADSNKISTGGEICGSVVIDSTVTAVDWYLYGTGNSSNLNIGIKTSTTTSGFAYSNGNAITNSSGNVISLQGSVPIVGWSSSTVVSSSADTRVVAAGRVTLSSTTITANTALQFTTSIFDTTGSFTSNSDFTVPIPGIYRVTLTGATLSSGTANFNARVNGTDRALLTTVGTARISGSALVNVTAGQIITVASDTSVTASSAAAVSVYIERISGPSQIAASEVILAKATSSTTTIGTSATIVINPTEVKDTHGGYDTSTGRYTCPAPGDYEVTFGWNSATNVSSGSVGAGILGYARKGATNVSLISEFMYQQTGSSIAPHGYSSPVIIPNCVAGDLLDVTLQRSAAIGSFALDGIAADCWVQFRRLGGVM